MRAIIPCAGFGTRVEMKPDESKEMLLDSKGKPLIDYSLKLCKKYKLNPLVITRPEKRDLIDYIQKKHIDYILVNPNGEWYNTVIMSQNQWEEDNLLLLPDTRFKPDSCIKDIQRGLQLGNQAVMALHEVLDPFRWGIVRNNMVEEKPKNLEGPQMAWGLIGFKNYYGRQLFHNMNPDLVNILKNTGFCYLKEFKDITRK